MEDVDGQALGIKVRKEEMESFNETWGMGKMWAMIEHARFDGI